MTDHHLFLAAVLILLAVTAVSVTLFKRLGLGSILGLLAAGLVVGPSGLALSTQVEELREFTEIGVVFLLFVIGLEMNLGKLWSMRRQVFGLGLLQVVVTGFIIAGYTRLTGEPSWNVAIFMGLAFSLSSTAFVLQLLTEKGELATEHGKSAFAVLLFQDLAVVPLLALVPVLAGSSAAQTSAPWWQAEVITLGVLLAIYLLGEHLVPRALDFLARQRNTEAFTVVAVLAVLAAAWGAEEAGLSMALGSFLMGMFVSRSRFKYQIGAVIEPYKWLFLSLFFIAVGMSLNMSLLLDMGFELVFHLGALFVIKTLVLWALCLAFGLGQGPAIQVALLMPQCGEFAFVLFGAATGVGLISADFFAEGILFVSISMTATPLLTKLGKLLAEKIDARKVSKIFKDEPGKDMHRHVVVAGYGRVGRIISILLERSGVPYLAFDLDASMVALGKQEGHAVYFGDISNPELMAAAGVAEAAAVVVTTHNMQVNRQVVSTLRNFYPEIPVFVRVRDLPGRDEMVALGVTQAVPEAAESSLQLGKFLLFNLGIPRETVLETVETLRQDDYAAIRLAG
jgi:glutathione-regulated potassium-efflux system ancillary protein KefC